MLIMVMGLTCDEMSHIMRIELVFESEDCDHGKIDIQTSCRKNLAEGL